MKIRSRHLRSLLAAVIAVSAIAVPVVTAQTASAATELTFWRWRPEDKVFYESQAAIFKEQTGISVKFTPVSYTHLTLPTKRIV